LRIQSAATRRIAQARPAAPRDLPGPARPTVTVDRRRGLLNHGTGRTVLRSLALALVILLPSGAAIAIPGAAFANSCNTVASSNWSNNCTVSQDMANNMVEAVQETLNAWAITSDHRSCGSLSVDGVFGPLTLAAVKCFQGHNGDGIVGPATWGKMFNLLSYESADAGWWYYKVAGIAGKFREWSVPPDNWYVHSGISGKYVQMNFSGPN
jgi:peptidoglycan hydrolase-like protein with peptidoglycan-binding domain